jgi:hypothetical protein
MRDARPTTRSVSRAPRVVALCGVLAAFPLRAGTAWAQSATPAVADRPASFAATVARHREALYVAGAASGVAANLVWRYHAGSRVGADLWSGHDKALHAGAASSLTLAGIGAGVRPWVAASTVCAAGGAFELTQLRASGKDATVNCLSAATAWVASALARRWTSPRR